MQTGKSILFLNKPFLTGNVSKLCRLIVNINDLRNRLPDRARALLENSFDELAAVQRALKEVVATIDPNYAKEKRKCCEGNIFGKNS